MSDKAKQQISNLMDGELEINASKFLLKRMASDKSLSQTWDSYHLIKSCLQKKTQEPLVVDVAFLVTQQLSNNPELVKIEHEVKNKAKVHPWLKPVLGLGIAASVAFMSVVMLQTQDINSDNSTTTTLANNNNAIAQPFKPAISARYASSDKSLVPPPSLSRFPSVSAKNSMQYNQGFSQNMTTPYMIIINQTDEANKIQQAPIIIKNVSD